MTAPLTPADLAALRALCDKATPGPWEWWTSCSFRRLTGPGGRDGGVLCAVVQRSDGHPDVLCREEDRAFIAASREAMPRLLDALEAAQRRVKRWQDREVARAVVCCGQEERAIAAEAERDAARAEVERLRGALGEAASALDVAVNRVGFACSHDQRPAWREHIMDARNAARAVLGEEGTR